MARIAFFLLAARVLAKLNTENLHLTVTMPPNPQVSALSEPTYPDVLSYDLTQPQFKFRGSVFIGLGNIYKRSTSRPNLRHITRTTRRKLTKIALRLKTCLKNRKFDVRVFEPLEPRFRIEIEEIVQEMESYRKENTDNNGEIYSTVFFGAVEIQYEFVLNFFEALSNALSKWKDFRSFDKFGSNLLFKVIEVEVSIYAEYNVYGVPDFTHFLTPAELTNYIRDLERSLHLCKVNFRNISSVSPILQHEFSNGFRRAQNALVALTQRITG